MSAATGERPAANVEVAGAGDPVVLLHGWGCSVDLVRPVAALLPRRQTVSLDFPGFGGTAEPPEPWGVSDYAAWVVALLDRLGLDRVTLVGHSFGGRVAIHLATGWPERVARIVLTGAAGIRPRRSVAYHLRVRLYKSWKWLAATGWVPAPLRTLARRRVEARGSRDYRATSGVMRGTFVRIVNEDLTPLLPRIAVPALLVWGDRDDETPLSDGRTMERLIPDAGLVVFEGRGHYAYLEEAGRFAHIVDTFMQGAP